MVGRRALCLSRLLKTVSFAFLDQRTVEQAAGRVPQLGLSLISVQQLWLTPELGSWSCGGNHVVTFREHWEKGVHSKSNTLYSKHASNLQKREFEEPWGAHKRQVKIGDRNEGDPVIYRGQFSETLRKVKLLSLTSCCLSLITGPAITFMTSPHLSIILKGGVASAVVILSASTTAALHWFTSPYVHRLLWKPGSQEIEVEVYSWLATRLRKTIQLSDVRPPKTNRPFVTFAANGNFYFVDPEKFPHKELLRKLSFYRK